MVRDEIGRRTNLDRRRPGHPNTLDESVLAHTSPVYVDIAGQRVARLADAQWCLEFFDTLDSPNSCCSAGTSDVARDFMMPLGERII